MWHADSWHGVTVTFNEVWDTRYSFVDVTTGHHDIELCLWIATHPHGCQDEIPTPQPPPDKPQVALTSLHYTDVIMGTIASQITSLAIVYSTVYSGADKKIKALHHWPLCGEFTGAGEFRAQMTSNAENVSIWWRHHGASVGHNIHRHFRHDYCMTFSWWAITLSRAQLGIHAPDASELHTCWTLGKTRAIVGHLNASALFQTFFCTTH